MITKFLCKYCDSGNKGYVTLADVLGSFVMLCIGIVVTVAFGYCMYMSAHWVFINRDINLVDPVVLTFGALSWVGVISVVTIKVLDLCEKIKVAECKRKQ